MSRRANPVVPLTTEQQDLATKYIPLARSMTFCFCRKFPRWHEEIDSCAMMALVTAARDWDGCFDFSTYFRRIFRFRINDMFRVEAKGGFRGNTGGRFITTLSLKNALDYDLHDHRTLLDRTMIDEMEYVERVLMTLPKTHRLVMQLVVIHDLSQVEISKIVGKSEGRISDILKEGRSLVRRHLMLEKSEEELRWRCA